MEIKIKLNKPINGYWDGGQKDVFIFEPEYNIFKDDKIIRWGSWEANYWFKCKKGKTNKLSIKYALQSLKPILKKLDIKNISTEID